MKRVLRVTTCFVFLMMVFILLKKSAYAYNTVENGKVTINYEEEYYDEETEADHYSINFKSTGNSYLMLAFDVKTSGEDCEEGGLRFILKDKQGNILEDDKLSLKGYYSWKDDYCYTGKKHPPSEYTWTIYNTSDLKLYISYEIREYSDIAKNANIKKKKSVKSDTWVKIGKLDKNLPWIKTVKFSSKKVLSGYDIHPDGSIHILAKKPGTATATVILKNGKKYKCKITVKASDPNFGAYLDDYYTRDNYFTVRIKNNGISDLKIIRSGRVINSEYKTFDRKLKSMSSVTIKPGKSKTVRFYCKGTTTWYDASQYTIYAKVKYQGKTHVWHVWDEDSVIKKGKSWYNTYWNEDWYKEWNSI